jgi:SynChlorMet cassette protein ScmD
MNLGKRPDMEILPMVQDSDRKVIANPLIVLREEFDDWALLFNPDTGNTFALNPLGVLIWKMIAEGTSLREITEATREETEDFPSEGENEVADFIAEILRLGLAARDGETDA